MNLNKLVGISFVSVFLVSCQSSKNVASLSGEVHVISRDKIANVQVDRLSFLGKEEKASLPVIDVTKDDVIQIFKELKRIKFPIYTAHSYSPRGTRNGMRVSLHAYAAAIDLNYLMNPYFDAVEGIMIPGRSKNREKDKRDIVKQLKKISVSDKEISSVVDVVINNQPQHSDDRFLNRSIVRKGMVTPKVVAIFKRHGFSEWGGNWRRPIDYMHFQIPRSIAKKLARTDNLEERRKIWDNHKKTVAAR